jgi:hypothetical protein
VCFRLFYFSFIINVDDEIIAKDDQDTGNNPDEENKTGNQPNNNEDQNDQGFILFIYKSIIFIACILISHHFCSDKTLSSCLDIQRNIDVSV